MRGRPRQFDEDGAVEAALAVFMREGFEGASCEQLLEAMGMNSGSMYAAFGGKRALYDKAFERYRDRAVGMVLHVLDAPGSPLGNVRTLVNMWADLMSRPGSRGCFVDCTLIELGDERKGVAELARETAKRLQAKLEAKLTEARDAGELAPDADPAALAAFLINTKQGLSVMARAGASEATIRGITNTTLSLLTR